MEAPEALEAWEAVLEAALALADAEAFEEEDGAFEQHQAELKELARAAVRAERRARGGDMAATCVGDNAGTEGG